MKIGKNTIENIITKLIERRIKWKNVMIVKKW